MSDNRTRNRALVRHLLLPTIFLTVALLGGLRVSAETGAFVFIAPPLVTLVLAVLLAVLFVRGRALDLGRWLSGDSHPLTNVSHALTLVALFFASAQAFNSVLPESGLLRWMFSFFFLWTLWNNQFSSFDARRLVRSLAALFGTAFVLKHMLLASLYAPDSGWLRRLAGALLEGITLGTTGGEAFAPSTGYISFFTLALYVGGLALLPPAPGEDSADRTRASEFITRYRELSTGERSRLRATLLSDEANADDADKRGLKQLSATIEGELIGDESEKGAATTTARGEHE